MMLPDSLYHIYIFNSPNGPNCAPYISIYVSMPRAEAIEAALKLQQDEKERKEREAQVALIALIALLDKLSNL